MASITISKTQKISDFRFRKEESIYERLQGLIQGAKGFHSEDRFNYNEEYSSDKTIEQQLQAQKDKALKQALLHFGTINF